MKLKKTEILVQKEQNNLEESAIAKKSANAHFSSRDINDKEPSLVQIDFDQAINQVENKTNIPNEVEQINVAEETVAKQKTKKRRWTSLILMLVNIIIVIVILLTQIKGDNMVSFNEIIESGINGWFLVLCFAAFATVSLLEGMRVDVFIKQVAYKHNLGLAYKTAIIGRYYDCVTPLATGGQPFQIYYLNKRGMNASQSIAVPMGKYVFHQITHVIFFSAVIFSTLSGSLGSSVGTTVVSAASWLGYVLNCGLIFIVLLLTINRKIGSKMVGGIIKLLYKMKIVKNFDKTYNNVLKIVDDFQSTIKYYVKSPKTFITSVLLAGANIIIHYTIPFLIYCTFAGYETGMWSIILVRCVMIDLASSFIPLPGGTGVAELSFTTLFASLFVGGRLFWALLLWRLLTYYGYIFQGLAVIIYDYAYGDKKYFWQKRKGELETESETFKAKQLSEFKSKKVKNKKIK